MKFNVVANICYLINSDDQVLLQKKARGFGKGNWNGPGGKKEEGETVEEAMIREVEEETGIQVKQWEKRGELEFVYPLEESNNFISHVFVAKDWVGEPQDKGEGELRWFDKNKIPLDKMWDDDKYWLMALLEGKYVKMRFYFDENNKVSKYEVLN